MIKPVDIKEPIWSSRSVGLKVNNLNPGDMIDVIISYRGKDGNLSYPGTFRIPLETILQHKPLTVRGQNIGVYEVPISTLLAYRLKDDLQEIESKESVPVQKDLFKPQTSHSNGPKAVDDNLLKTSELTSEDIRNGYRAIRIVLIGEPVAKQSTRFYVRRDKKTGNVMTYYNNKNQLCVFTDTYTEPKYKEIYNLFENQVKLLIRNNYPNWIMFSEIVHVMRFECIFKHPKNFPKYKIHAIQSRTAIFYKPTQPDLPDNLKKIPFDAMEGLVFKNDGLIVTENNTIKRYGIRPGIIIEMKGK